MSYIAARHDGTADAPLVMTFHGTGGDESQFHDLATQLVPDAHVVSPRGDVSEGGAARYFRRTGEGVYDMADLARRTDQMAAFIAQEKERTGAREVIALGYSNGANIAASVLFQAPQLIDVALLLHPLIPWRPDPQPGLSGRRILITAGRRDPICPPQMTEALIDYLTDQNADLQTEWHDGGHELRQSEMVAMQTFLAR